MFAAWDGRELVMYWPVLVQGMLVSVALGLVGCFLVVRGMSLLGDALSHAVLPGIVIGFLIGRSLHSPWILFGASAMGLLAAVLVQAVKENSRVKEDASLGIVFTTLFALGVLMINYYAGQADLDPNCVLYGNLAYFVAYPDHIWPMTVTLGVVVVGLVTFYRQLLLTTFDPALAVSLGISATVVHYSLMGVLSLTVVASFEAVGAILAVALLIMPGATARLWTDRMPYMLLLAGVHGILSTAIGYWISHKSVLQTSAAGAICSAGFLLFMLSWLFSPHRGLLTRWLARRKLRQTMATENVIKTIAEAGGVADTGVLVNELRLPPRVLRSAISRGMHRGWINAETDQHYRLSDRGSKHADRLRRAHELWEKFLHQEVGIASDHVHDPAEWIEHHLNEEELERLDQLLASRPSQQQSN